MFPLTLRSGGIWISLLALIAGGPVHATPGAPARTKKASDQATGEPVVAGMVLDTERKPIAGAKVLLATAAVREGTSPLCPSCYPDCAKSAVTDAEGRFRIESVDDALLFDVLVAAPGYQPTYVRRTDPRKGMVSVKLEKSQRTAQTLRGRVLDPEGRPVFGALVEPAWFELGKGRKQIGAFPGDDLAVTDQQGMFELTANSPQVKGVGVEISAPQLARRIFVPQAPGETVHDYTLDRGVTVRGRLLRDGQPVPNANVTIVQVDRNAETSLGPQTIGTDVSGKFELTNVPAGDYWTLSANRDTLPEGTVTGAVGVMTAAPDSEVELPNLTVEDGLPVRGQIVLTDGKMPPAGTRVLIDREGSWDPQTREVDAKGAFTFTARKDDEVQFYARVAGYTDGYDSGKARDAYWRPKGEKPTVEVRMAPKGQPPAEGPQTGMVVAPDGKPASGARIGMADGRQLLVVENGAMKSGTEAEAKADEAGRFALRLPPGGMKDQTVVALHESGWAVTSPDTMGKITLSPWGRVEGVAREGSKPSGAQPVVLRMSLAFDQVKAGVSFEERRTTGADGAFVFERVPAGLARLGISTGRRWILETHPLRIGFPVKAGETARVELGGAGATVRGKLDIPNAVRQQMDAAQVHAALREQRPQPAKNEADQVDWMSQQREHNFAIAEDGSFVIPDVLPGKYSLQITFPETHTEGDPLRPFPSTAGRAYGQVTVAKTDTEVVAKGLVCEARKVALRAGETVPEFAVKTSDGEAFTKASLKGRAALLIFTARGDDMPHILRAMASLPEDIRPVVICVGDDPVAGKPEPAALPAWVKSVSSSTRGELTEAFGVEWQPSYYLIGKDGIIASLNRSAEDAVRAVATSMKAK